MSSPLRLIVDVERKTLVSRAGLLVGVQFPTFHSGDSVDVEVALVRGTSLSELPFEPVALAGGETLEVFFGLDENRPTGGFYKIADGGGSEVRLSFDDTASAVDGLINSLADVVSSGVDVSVSDFGSGFLITHPLEGSSLTLSVDDSELVPNTAAAFLEAVPSTASNFPTWLLRFKREAVGSVSLASSSTSPAGTVDPVVAFVAAGTPAVVEVDAAGAVSGFVNLVFAGLDGDGNPATYSAQVFAGASSQAIASAIRSGFAGATGSLIRVEAVRSGVYRITSTFEPQALASNDGWSSENNLVGYQYHSGELDLTSADVEENLAGERLVEAVLEIRLSETGGDSRTLAEARSQLLSRLAP